VASRFDFLTGQANRFFVFAVDPVDCPDSRCRTLVARYRCFDHEVVDR
jgi:hypothetical protein